MTEETLRRVDTLNRKESQTAVAAAALEEWASELAMSEFGDDFEVISMPEDQALESDPAAVRVSPTPFRRRGI